MAKTFLSPRERRGFLFLSIIIVVIISIGLIRSCLTQQNQTKEIVIQMLENNISTTDSIVKIDKQHKKEKSKRKSNHNKNRKKSSYKERKPLEDIVPGK